MSGTRGRIPPHLRRHVVVQDYAAYDEIDQAVWRFVLLQTYDRLVRTAHPAYAAGLGQTGMSVERIPRIEEMDARLSEFGWGAVAVDGFIPPRAFQEFQALGILPIAADIRRPEHLAYTPAPDILHESAGHAPILPDPVYRDYLRRFGRVGARAFSSPADRRVSAAVHRLSEVKEDPGAAPETIARAERDLARAQAEVTEPSEAARLSRLHWWTVEYGLVGEPNRYRIYGAGLLSSLGESHFCHAPEVAKLPLSAACVETDYDITRPQPQLYVAESFEHLNAVLDEVAAGLAQVVGGAAGLRRALASEEVASVELDSGLQITGRLTRVRERDAEPAYLQFEGPCALAREGRQLAGHGPDRHPEGYGTPVGPLEDGSRLSERVEADLGRFAAGADPRDLRLSFRSGVRVRGRLERVRSGPDGRLELLTFSDCRVELGGDALFLPEWGEYDLAAAGRVGLVWAGASDPAYWPETEFPERGVPPRRRREGVQGRLLGHYRDALALWERPDSPELVSRFGEMAAALERDFPDEWLLPWNLLECLLKLGRGGALAPRLRRHLLEIESRFPTEAPITTGLRHLSERYPEQGGC